MQRYLVAINYDGPHERLAAEVRASPSAPTRSSTLSCRRLARGVHSEGQERALAQQLLDSITLALDGVPSVDGAVGDANLFGAIADELDRRPYDVLAMVTPPIGDREQERLVDQLVRLYRYPLSL